MTPTRSRAVRLRDERHSTREAYAFLDEKCLLLADRMLRELRPLLQAARQASSAAVMRHGVNGTQVCPAPIRDGELTPQSHSLLGVPMRNAQWRPPRVAVDAVHPSPEAEACRPAFARVRLAIDPDAAARGNLTRLLAGYRKSVLRLRALRDVLILEVEQARGEVEAALDELEQDEFKFLRRAANAAQTSA